MSKEVIVVNTELENDQYFNNLEYCIHYNQYLILLEIFNKSLITLKVISN
jgi:hypothetical protein